MTPAPKRLIFTATTGRSGTGYLAQLLQHLPGVTALHEPAPPFHLSAESARRDPAVARDFWLRHKLPAIAATPGRIYIETSHVACKGFIEPLLDLGITPDLIVLSRPHRDVALSFYQLGVIPGGSDKARQFLLAPSEAVAVPLPAPERLHPYQLCYWYCLEIAGRSAHLADRVRARGGRAVAMTPAALQQPDGLSRLVEALALPAPGVWGRLRLRRWQRRRVNTKAGRKQPLDLSVAQLDELEAALRAQLPAGTGGQDA